MSKPKRKCAIASCNVLIDYNEMYCTKHKQVKQEQAYERNKHYNNTIRYAEKNKQYADFYNSREWKNKRKQILIRDNYICQPCLKKGVIHEANMVHHKTELKDDWEKRLDEENLESVNTICHNKIEKKNRQNKKTK
ncbi:HNH endonuclease [Enterococcus faecalis]|uniref:HNH endonuclease n=1 Tax=Enterococcus faecalis TaxID=1351 RepID=UPI0015745E88|nr:HNH endonuclease [Enterococcus faecalis]MCL8363560.1 HNH endonuclease [Enterococcus faecalis]MDK6477864.1 HNH endonuclease [Enterococcus faecalis]NSP42598.1 HNH endonuclease [Enterococcus faecalis]HAP2790697.1 HNH endonuclease [Enterococcus faecalis]HAP3443004.1 HNH endonuclease [Enterococcus faecalis]